MAFEIPTTRVDLGNGHWADLYTEVKRITARLHEGEIRQHLRPLGEEPLLWSELTSEQKPWPNDYVLNPADVDQARIAEIYVLHQVKDWDFGPVDQATLDDMPRDAFIALRAAIDAQYESDPLAVSGGVSSQS
ncbi:MAG: hypothetical protein KAJ19_16305 [Gammaproteobacteria bacterium]|nr:hypothetical protein [Gammaproteobacteria bacterium]